MEQAPNGLIDLRGGTLQGRLSVKDVRPQIQKLELILRQMDRYHRLKHLLDREVTDLWLPIPKKIVQKLIGIEDTPSFLEAQQQYTDDDMQLNHLGGEHLTLLDSDSIGFDEAEQIGQGGFGRVHRVLHPWAYDGYARGYARKVMARPSYDYHDHRDVMKRFKKELVAMHRMRHHHHCVKIVASCTSPETVMLFSSPVADRNLAQLLDLDLTESELMILRRSMGCITSALAYLHHLDIRHEDLKPQNILIHGSNILLTDFGSCHEFTDNSGSTTTGRAVGTTPRYRAPEVVNSEDRNRLTDVWSLGCVLFEILARLQGYRLRVLMQSWRAEGTKENSFAQNRDAVALWFETLTRDRIITQQGYNRKYTWLCSFVYHALLNQTRLLRPSVTQIFQRLQDLDGIYPVDTILAPCCATNSGSFSSWISSCEYIPHWPILDVVLADLHLSHIFVDIDLRVLATSGNMMSLDKIIANTTNGHKEFKLEQLVPNPADILRLRNHAHSMFKPGNSHDGQNAKGETSTEVKTLIVNSIFAFCLKDTMFWVDTLNLMLNADGLPRLRTVQLSMQTFCLERQPGYKLPLIVITFDPNEGEVIDRSYRKDRDLWTDGISSATHNRNEEEVKEYRSVGSAVVAVSRNSEKARSEEDVEGYRFVTKAMQERKAKYDQSLNERRTHIKGFKKVQCSYCRLLGRTCSGPQAGGCEQCRATNTPCRFRAEDVEYGGEVPKYIDMYKQEDELSLPRWGS